jgi:hypothetical protein
VKVRGQSFLGLFLEQIENKQQNHEQHNNQSIKYNFVKIKSYSILLTLHSLIVSNFKKKSKKEQIFLNSKKEGSCQKTFIKY